MKKAFHLIIMSLLMLFLAQCDKEYEFEGFSYQIISKKSNISKHVDLNKTSEDSSNYISPISVDIAFSKIVFPSVEDAKSIIDVNLEANPNIRDQYPVASIDEYKKDGIVAFDQSTDDPFVVSLDNSDILTLDSLDLNLEDRYFGAIVQVVYYQFKMEDFSIRWYANDSESYKAMDVLIKQDTENQWKFAYQRVHAEYSNTGRLETYQFERFDTRQDSLFFTTWDQGIVADEGDLMHLAIHQEDDFLAINGDFGGGSFLRSPALLAYNLQSSDDVAHAFGRLDTDIIGITLEILYSFSGESTTGMQLGGVQLSQPNKMTFSDLSQTTDTAIKLYPTKSVEYGVIYDIAE